jgi:hypothetical protein
MLTAISSHYQHQSLTRVPGHLPPKVEKMVHDPDSKIKVPKLPSVSLDDMVTTLSGSIVGTYQYGSEACAGSDGREVCTG